MKEIAPYKGVLFCLTFLLIAGCLFLPIQAEAATAKEEATYVMTGDEPLIGKYQINYTGNTNYYEHIKGGHGGKIDPDKRYNYADAAYKKAAKDVLGTSITNSTSNTLKKENGANGNVKKAYLVWQTRAPEGANEAIALVRPDGTAKKVAAKAAAKDLRQTDSWSYNSLYCMYADVTDFVKASPSAYGTYSVCNIPIWTPSGTTLGESMAAWQLIVVEESENVNVRAVKLVMGAHFNQNIQLQPKTIGMELLLDLYTRDKMGVKDELPGQVFFAASTADAKLELKESIHFYKDGKENAGSPKRVNHSTSAGLNSDLISIKSETSCIRADLSNISYNCAFDANKMTMDLQSDTWSTFFIFGVALDIADKVLEGEQKTKVNSAASVTVSQRIINASNQRDTGYSGGILYLTLDEALTPKGGRGTLKIYNTKGGKIVTKSGIWDASNRIMTFKKVDSIQKGDYIEYAIECDVTPNSGKKEFQNSARLSGVFVSKGYMSKDPIDNLLESASSDIPMYTLTVELGDCISSVSATGVSNVGNTIQRDYVYNSAVSTTAVSVEDGRFTRWIRTNADGSISNIAKNPYDFKMPARNMKLVAYGELDVYTIRFNGNSSTKGSMSDMKCSYGKFYNLPANQFQRAGYSFVGWNTKADGKGTFYAEKASIKDIGNITLYAQWKIKQYTVTLHTGSGIEEVNGGGSYSYGASVVISADVKAGYHWKNWKGRYETEKQTYSFIMPAEDIEMTAEGEANQYTIAFHPNGGEGHIKSIAAQFDEEVILPDAAVSNAYVKRNDYGVSVYRGWNREADKEKYTPYYLGGETIKNLTTENNATVTLYAVWDDCPWIIAEDLYYTLEQAQNGFITHEELMSHAAAEDREDGAIVPGDHQIIGSENAYAISMGALYEVVGNRKNDNGVVLSDQEKVFDTARKKALVSEDEGMIGDSKEVIFKNPEDGVIEEESILEVKVDMSIDGDVLLEDVQSVSRDAAGKWTSFTMINYQETDFTQFQHEGSVTETYQVKDSIGNIYQKQITVYIVDTTAVTQRPERTTRFINEKYYRKPYENGGVEADSIWKTDPEYCAVLESAFQNQRNGTPEETYRFMYEDILKMREFIRENGIGNKKREDALQRFYQQFLETNRQ